MTQKPTLHPRNRHQGRYDFPSLIKAHPDLARFTITNPHGKPSIDFANPEAVRVFNRALLKAQYGIQHWDIPTDYLCPPIPGRADYLHVAADLLAEDNAGEVPKGAQIRALDIGVGANCIYPLLGHSDYRWRFLGSDIDPVALASAKAIVQANGLSKGIALRQQDNPRHILAGLLQADERFDLTLCNPPFHASREEATRGSQRKWKNLGKQDPKRKLPVLNFGGQNNELWCEGGEIRFVSQLVGESVEYAHQVLWFTSLVSKASNLPGIEAALKRPGPRHYASSKWAKVRNRAAWSPGVSMTMPHARHGTPGANHTHKKTAPGQAGRGFVTPSTDYLLMESLRALAGTNLTTFLAAISMAAPVEGLRPVRAGRSETFSLPMPGSVISAPFSSWSATIWPSCSSALRAVVFGASMASAMSAISWSLVNAMVVFLPYQIQWLCSALRRYRASP